MNLNEKEGLLRKKGPLFLLVKNVRPWLNASESNWSYYVSEMYLEFGNSADDRSPLHRRY